MFLTIPVDTEDLRQIVRLMQLRAFGQMRQVLARMEAAMGRLRFRPGLNLALIADRAVAMEGLDQMALLYLTCSRTLISSQEPV